MVRRYVRSRNLVNEEAVAHWGLSPQKQTKKQSENYKLPQNGGNNLVSTGSSCAAAEDVFSKKMVILSIS
jgi:hypothetical protein